MSHIRTHIHTRQVRVPVEADDGREGPGQDLKHSQGRPVQEMGLTLKMTEALAIVIRNSNPLFICLTQIGRMYLVILIITPKPGRNYK